MPRAVAHAFTDASVASVFDAYPAALRTRLLAVRDLIFDVADDTSGVGEIEEVLRWGQPAYLTSASKSGSLIRVDRYRHDDRNYAIFFHCQTTLVDTFREIYRAQLSFDGNRCIVLPVAEDMPVAALRDCIKRALTYHQKTPVHRANSFSARATVRRSIAPQLGAYRHHAFYAFNDRLAVV